MAAAFAQFQPGLGGLNLPLPNILYNKKSDTTEGIKTVELDSAGVSVKSVPSDKFKTKIKEIVFSSKMRKNQPLEKDREAKMRKVVEQFFADQVETKEEKKAAKKNARDMLKEMSSEDISTLGNVIINTGAALSNLKSAKYRAASGRLKRVAEAIKGTPLEQFAPAIEEVSTFAKLRDSPVELAKNVKSVFGRVVKVLTAGAVKKAKVAATAAATAVLTSSSPPEINSRPNRPTARTSTMSISADFSASFVAIEI